MPLPPRGTDDIFERRTANERNYMVVSAGLVNLFVRNLNVGYAYLCNGGLQLINEHAIHVWHNLDGHVNEAFREDETNTA